MERTYTSSVLKPLTYQSLDNELSFSIYLGIFNVHILTEGTVVLLNLVTKERTVGEGHVLCPHPDHPKSECVIGNEVDQRWMSQSVDRQTDTVTRLSHLWSGRLAIS